MSQFLYDKAFMALKAKRYDEAQSTYEKALEQEYTVDAWCGLGICKLFQLATGQTMEEVIYCFDKAAAIEGADKNEIDKKLVTYTNLVLSQYAAFAIAGIKNAIEAEKAAATAALISIASIGLGAMSSGLTTKIIAGVAAGAAAGVAVGKFGEMKGMKEIANYATHMLNDTYDAVNVFLLENTKFDEAKLLTDNVKQLNDQIFNTLPAHAQAEARRQIKLADSKAITSSDNDVEKLKAAIEAQGTYYTESKHGPIVCLDEAVILGNENLSSGTAFLSGGSKFKGQNLKSMLEPGEQILFGLRNSIGEIQSCFTNKGIATGSMGWSGVVIKYVNYADIPSLGIDWMGTITAGTVSFSVGIHDFTGAGGQHLINNILTPFIQGKSTPDIADQLEKLHSMKEKGILTEEEFQARKNKLL